MTETGMKIKGALLIKGIQIKNIASSLGLSITFVSAVINQKKKSKRVMQYITKILGSDYQNIIK